MNPKTTLACTLILSLALNLCSVFPANSSFTTPLSDIHVPSDYPTIQAAINNATPGDTIIVANGTYSESLTINKTVTLVGAGASQTTLNGTKTTTAIQITADNVTVKDFNIQNFKTGIIINQTKNTLIAENQITRTWTIGAVYILSSSNITISNNTISNNSSPGINVLKSNTTKFLQNTITHNDAIGISLNYCSDVTAIGNQIESNLGDAIYSIYSYNLHVEGNTLALSDYRGIWAVYSNGTVFHNNFLNNRYNARCRESNLTWDNGYPSGGNYWSNYTGVDLKRGTYQNETGSDGIGDTPHIIDIENNNTYPLTKPYAGPHDIGISDLTTSKTIIAKSYNLSIIAKIVNYGTGTESFNATVYANATTIATYTGIVLTGRNSTTLSFNWFTINATYGNYTIKVTITAVQDETDTTDNTNNNRTVKVTIPGDYNGDFHVNESDADQIRLYWLQTSPPAPANLDINNDGIINIKDATIIGANWQKHT